MSIEERMLGKKLSRSALIAVRVAEVVFIVLCLLYLGDALQDALGVH